MNPVRLTWTLRTRAPITRAWEVLADTDRFNRNAGLGFRFTERAQDDGSVRRTGAVDKLGMTLTWDEEPFQFERPLWFRSERRFHGGPAARVVARLALAPVEGGTEVRYAVEITPRTALAWPVVAADARLTVRPQLDRALRAAVAHLDADAAYDPPCPPLAPEADRRVAQVCALLPTIGDRLADWLRHAPLAAQDRLSPLQLAASWDLPDDDVIRELLEAVRGGILELRWDLACPSCRGAKSRRARLSAGPIEVHCPSCNIPYDGSLPDALVVSFRPHASIRRFDVEPACLLGPMRTPHVLAAQHLEAGATLAWTLPLQVGGHRLDTDVGAGGGSLEVREGLAAREVTVDITEHGVVPPILRVGPGEVRVTVRSRLGRDVAVRLSERSLGPHVLTAARLLEVPRARQLLPAGALDLSLRSGRGFVVAVEQVGATVSTARRVEVYSTAVEALDAIGRLRGCAVALGVGSVTWLGDGDGARPSGELVHRVVAAAKRVGAGRVLVVTPDDGDLVDAVRDSDIKVKVRDGLVFLRFPRAATPEAEAVEQIGPYHLGEVLGTGGFGVVRAAVGPPGEVAVKLLLPDISRDPSHAQRFYNEARITAALAHPNTVAVHDWGTADNGQLYLVMERLAGEPLEERVGDGRTVRAHEAVEVALGILSGLEAAHAHGVVHRDLKPGNVFLCPDRVKLIDFGIAASPGDEESETEVLGTPRYMSPEQVEGEPLDGRADLYALGLMLYEAFAGDIPFRAPTPTALAYKRVVEEPVHLREVTREPLPPGLADVVMRALAREPAERWPDAAAMYAALAAFRGSEGSMP